MSKIFKNLEKFSKEIKNLLNSEIKNNYKLLFNKLSLIEKFNDNQIIEICNHIDFDKIFLKILKELGNYNKNNITNKEDNKNYKEDNNNYITNKDNYKEDNDKTLFYSLLPNISFLINEPADYIVYLKNDLKIHEESRQDIFEILYSFEKDFGFTTNIVMIYFEYLDYKVLGSRRCLIFLLQLLTTTDNVNYNGNNNKICEELKINYVIKIIDNLLLLLLNTQQLCDVLVILKYLFNDQPHLLSILKNNNNKLNDIFTILNESLPFLRNLVIEIKNDNKNKKINKNNKINLSFISVEEICLRNI